MYTTNSNIFFPYNFRDKYSIKETKTGYKTHMVLTIRNIQKKDMSTYFCISTNSLGKAEGPIRLYGKLKTMSLTGNAKRQMLTQNQNCNRLTACSVGDVTPVAWRAGNDCDVIAKHSHTK